jgi:Bacterial Ig-like domain (group 2)
MGLTKHWHCVAAAWVMGGLALLSGCGGGGSGDSDGSGGPPPPPPPTVATVTVSPASATIDAGAKTSLTAQARDSTGAAMTGVTFTWTSSDATVATVADGEVTGVAAGSANISASSGGVTSASVALTVRAAPAASASSEELIAQALAAGTIDAETALVYRTLAAFDSWRLPDAYRGGVVGQHSGVLTELIQRYDTLTADVQKKLQPYLQRPNHEGSWLDPAVRASSVTGAAAGMGRRQALAEYRRCLASYLGWTSAVATNAKVRVWYRYDKAGQDAMASKVASYVEGSHASLVTGAAFKVPAGDGTLLCNGGDDMLDIYLVEGLGNRGETVPNTSDRYQSSVYIFIRDSLDDEQLRHAVSHEYMHAIHWTYKTQAQQDDYGWFRDAIANWATDHVYPGNASLLAMAACQLNSPHVKLESRAVGHCGSGVNRDYGAYLPLRHFEKTLGLATVRNILAATETYSTAAEAMDKTLPEGLDKHWPLYGARLWNQEATDAVYGPATFKVWDQLTTAVTVHKPVLAPDLSSKTSADLQGLPKDETALATELEHLSNKYYHFTFTEEATRSLMFHNTFQPKRKQGVKVSVRAFFKPENQAWQEEDWSDYEWIGWCRDFKDQRLAELVIVVSSAEWQPARPKARADEAPKLMRNNIGCWAFKGTAKRTFSQQSWGAGKSVVTFNPDYDGHPSGVPAQYTDRADGRLRVPIAAPLFSGGSWTMVEGFSDGPCTFTLNRSGRATSILGGGDAASSIVIDVFNESLPDDLRRDLPQVIGTRPRGYHINGVSKAIATGSVAGPSECGSTYESGIGAWLLSNADAAGAPVVPPSGNLKGSFTASQPSDSYTETFEWDLVPVRQP